MVFADLVGSEKLKNEITNAFQKNPKDWNLDALRKLQDEYPSLTTMFDIILEQLAWVIVTKSWAQFWGSPEGVADWNRFICEKDNSEIINKLLLKIDELNNASLQKSLICPLERRDCKWHEHLTDELKAKCPSRNSTLR